MSNFSIAINGQLVEVNAEQVATGVVALPADLIEAAKTKAEKIQQKAAHRLSEARVLGAIRFGLADTITEQEDIDTLNYLLERGYVHFDLEKYKGGYRLAGWGRYDRAKENYPEVIDSYRTLAATADAE